MAQLLKAIDLTISSMSYYSRITRRDQPEGYAEARLLEEKRELEYLFKKIDNLNEYLIHPLEEVRSAAKQELIVRSK